MKTLGGINANRIRFSLGATEIFDSIVDNRRSQVILDVSSALLGSRFKDDNNIFMRLESLCSEPEFLSCPSFWIDEALIDAARADYWYEREKDYGYEGGNEDANEDDE